MKRASGASGFSTTRLHVASGYQRAGLTGGPAPPAGATYWYKADTLSGLADGTLLTSWTDSSNSGHNLTSIVGTPTYYKTTAANLIHGHPAVRFNGNGSAATASAVTLNQPFTVCFIGQAANIQNMYAFGEGAGSVTFQYTGGTGAPYEIFAGSALSGGAADLNVHVFSVQFNTTASLARRDGTTVITSGNAGTNNISTVFVVGGANTSGGSFEWNGLIGELLVYPSAISATVMGQVETYLTTKWT